jgi:signal transduction histidine kinase
MELEAFSYSVSHDLRAPLRAISGFSEIIARRHRADLNEEGQHYVDNVVMASKRMDQLINDLLGYSRLGRSSIRLRPIDLTDLLNEIRASVIDPLLADVHGVLTVADDLPRVQGDEGLLGRVFTNLLENAIKYHDRTRPLTIAVDAQRDGDHVVVTVQDNGIGIAPGLQGKIFTLFQRLHSEDAYPGTGIGLATVKKVVNLLNGSVWVESQPDQGSTFFVKLPRG